MRYKTYYIEELEDVASVFPEKKGSVILRQRKNRKKYIELYCGFDIETTTLSNHHAYMYHWQFSINDVIIMGRTWTTFLKLIHALKVFYKLTDDLVLIVWIANMSYEFQWLRKILNVTKIFAREVRQPLYAVIDDCIEFRDCLAITGGSLSQLAKDYTTTQKLVGDLDYSVERSFLTPLTEKEKEYCINDVAILSEFSEYIFNTYIRPRKFCPITKTGIIRRDVKKGANLDVKQEIYRCYPKSFSFYHKMMMYLFRGGYVHSNFVLTAKVLEDVTGIDITSSYPFEMLTGDYYPVSPFIETDPNEFNDVIEKKCCIFICTFVNLRSKTAHSIESESKVICLSGERIIDNGRIRRAECVTLFLSDIDYKIYNLFYDWDSLEIHELYTAVKGKLPKYVLTPLIENYRLKAKLKKEGKSDTQEYKLAKEKVNSFYGMMLTRLSLGEVQLVNGDWRVDYSTFDFEKERKKAFLLPQWGIYVTAGARYSLLSVVAQFPEDVIYNDTDSIKMLNYEKHKSLICQINKEKEKKVLAFCDRFEIEDVDFFRDLGSFDLEYTGVRFKTLGAKRYLVEDKDGYHVTVAGLPKKALQEYCIENRKEPFNFFTDKMLLSSEVSMKNASAYNDEPHSDIVDGVPMFELSSVGIYPIDFTLKLDKYYKLMIGLTDRKEINLEKRII